VGHAPLGGEREIALAVLMIARLSWNALGEHSLSAVQRAERATAAKAWLASLAVPARARPALVRALDATARDGEAIAAALNDLVNVVAQWLDEPSMAELRAVTAAPFVHSR
jgi:hypothetical protein